MKAVGAEIHELLSRPILLARADDAAVWMDGTEASCLMASIARCDAFSAGAEWERVLSCAVAHVFRVQRVSGVHDDRVLADLTPVVGAVSGEHLERLYGMYLAALSAAHDGHPILLSATGSDAVLCRSIRFAAAFDDLEGDEYFGIRKSLWGVRGTLDRYSRLIGAEVKAKKGEKPLDTMQRYEIDIAKDVADTESRVGILAGVEVRHPFLDRRLTGYVRQLPHSLRYQV